MVRFDPFVSMTARRYRQLIDKYGEVAGTSPAHPDATLVKLTDIKPVPVADPSEKCAPLPESTPVPKRLDIWQGLNSWTRLVLRAQSTDVDVQLRRYEKDSWVTVGRIPAGITATLDLPNLLGRSPWVLRTSGACAVRL
jgi:hypothetical protein